MARNWKDFLLSQQPTKPKYTDDQMNSALRQQAPLLFRINCLSDRICQAFLIIVFSDQSFWPPVS